MPEIAAACLVLTALLAYLKHRFIGLPITIGAMMAALMRPNPDNCANFIIATGNERGLAASRSAKSRLGRRWLRRERNVVLTVRFGEVPWVGVDDRARVEALGHGFWRVSLNFGFMDTPDVPKALRLCEAQGLAIPLFETSYFLSRETIVPTPGAGMAQWREKLFAAMSRNAGSVVEYFRLPDNAVVELGTRVQI